MNFKMIIIALIAVLISSCEYTPSSNDLEHAQQELGSKSLIRNQPVPDLGGYSFERELVIQVYLARNTKVVSTWSYFETLTGDLIEVCPSMGYPIPYAVQLTNPSQIEWSHGDTNVIGNPEPNGLFSPDSAEASWIQCVNTDGSISPVYAEPRTVTLPFRVKSARKLERIAGTTTYKIKIKHR